MRASVGGQPAVVQGKDVNGVAAGGRFLAVFPSRKHETGGHALQVPFEGRGAGFIEVIDVEDEASVRRGVGAEVTYMGVAADLRDDSGVGQCGQVRGHDRRGTAKEAEGRNEHALVLQSDQGRDASPHGASDGGDG